MVEMIDYEERVPAKGCNGPYEVNRLGEVFNAKTGLKIKLVLSTTGYLFFNDYDANDGVQKHRKVQRIVLLSFDIPNPENKRTVNHKNGIKTDNRLENLEWHTDKEQMVHARDVLGVVYRKKGTPSPNKGKPKHDGSGTSPRPVRGIHLKTGEQREFESICEAARQVGGNHSNICLACRGKYKSSVGYRWEYI